MAFVKNFLEDMASEKNLSPREIEVFLALLGDDKSRVQIAEALHISESAVSTRLTEIYKKFQISGRGPVKESRLKDYLTDRYRRLKAENTEDSSIIDKVDQNIDGLVQEVRSQIQPYIQEKCGTMRVLDMSQPIGLGKIYTSVNILEKLTRTRGLELAELAQDTDPEKFERFCLGNVRERRVPGLEAVEKFSKLMILGKPGAGKTTFLKHLAMQCISGKFQVERVPIFITLKDFAEADGQPDLWEYIGQQFNDGIQTLTEHGRVLILLDGLDEVRETDSSRILRQIREFSQQFPKNQFVITCRIAAREYTFVQFTEVEIADFDYKQIADFSNKWFRSKNDLIKANRFLQKLNEDPPIRKLATNPLLLTLLCLVFEDSGSFPSNRTRLYEQGIDKLLRKWNPLPRERDLIYKKLSPDYREELLCQIAWDTFRKGKYFFNQQEVRKLIREYIKTLPGITPEDFLKLDSRAMLESIEVQHGLLIARARGIYSFSHLTFHEYFTARKIVVSCNVDDQNLQSLVSHITENRWREVFLLIVQMLDSADVLLLLMKAQIDGLLAGDEKLQQFLQWVDDKARLVEEPYKLSAVRSFYLAFTQDLESCPQSHLCLHIDSKFYTNFEALYDDAYGFFSRPDDLTRELIFLLFANRFTEGYFNLPISKIKLPNKNYFPGEEEYDFWSYCSGPPPCGNGYFNSYILEIMPPAQYYLPKNHPATTIIWEYLDGWWAMNNQAWTEQLRDVMIEHRNFGHNWQFSDEQNELLQQYYYANKLLVDCLNLPDIYVSREVRQEIEDTLLLPIEEIKKRNN